MKNPAFRSLDRHPRNHSFRFSMTTNPQILSHNHNPSSLGVGCFSVLWHLASFPEDHQSATSFGCEYGPSPALLSILKTLTGFSLEKLYHGLSLMSSPLQSRTLLVHAHRLLPEYTSSLPYSSNEDNPKHVSRTGIRLYEGTSVLYRWPSSLRTSLSSFARENLAR